MKKLILTFLLGLMPLAIAAQEQDPWIGEWIGKTKMPYYDRMKNEWYNNSTHNLHIKIDKFGNEYKIRLKQVYEGGVQYETGDITILEANPSRIMYKIEGEYCRDGNDLFKNVWYYLLSYQNGYIHFEHISASVIYYDVNKRYLREDTHNFDKSLNVIDLYRNDNNW